MKRLLIIVFLLIACSAYASSPYFNAGYSGNYWGDNLVTNPGFETGDLTGWTTSPTDGTASVVTGQAQSETYAVSLATTTGSLGVVQNMSVSEGDELKLSGWTKKGAATNVQLRFYGCTGLDEYYSNTSSTYVQYVYYYTVPAGCSTITVQFRNDYNGTTAYGDSMSVRKKL